MAVNTYNSILRYGTQAAYEAIAVKDANVLYFCTDTGKIYKGTVDFSNHVEAVATKPATGVAGKVYVVADTDTVEVYVGGKWKVISYPMVTTVDASSDDVHVASAKAVYDAIVAAVEDLADSANVVKGISNGTGDAVITVTMGNDSTSDVTVKGVVTTPTWDSVTRKLTLPVSGGNAVEVNIGKDIFLDSTADNKYNEQTHNIDLYLNDGTKLEIPAASLIDVYTGTTTDTATVSVSDANVISMTVKVDPDSKNVITVSDKGLKVDLTATNAAIKAAHDAADAAQEAADAAQADADTANAAIAVLNGTESQAGSVKKAIADAKSEIKATTDALDTAVKAAQAAADAAQSDADTANEAIAVLNGDGEGSIKKAIETAKAEIDGAADDLAAKVAENTANIAALAAATTQWGTF